MSGAGDRVRQQRRCAAGVRLGDDANNNGKLDVGETWTFTRLASTSRRTTSTTARSPTTPRATRLRVDDIRLEQRDRHGPCHPEPEPRPHQGRAESDLHVRGPDPPLHLHARQRRQRDPRDRSVTDDNAMPTPVYASGDTDGDGKFDVTETWIFTAQHVVTLAEIYAGSITNNAVGHATFHAAPVTSNTATKTIGATAADLAITKTSSAPWVYVDNPMTYTVTIKNFGPSTATNVVVNDPLAVRARPSTLPRRRRAPATAPSPARSAASPRTRRSPSRSRSIRRRRASSPTPPP